MIFRKMLTGSFSLPFVILFIPWILMSPPCFSQKAQTISLKEIPQKKVRHYIETREINYMQDFSLIHASWKKGTDPSAFRVHQKTFIIDNKLKDVWSCYRHAYPVKSWNTHFIKVGLLISKDSNTVTYLSNSIYPQVDTGQVVFLDLKIFKGLLNVPLAFEITNIDPFQKILEFSYIDGNKSSGKQTIQFFDNGDGRTRIVHKSYFKSDSPFRDKILYPYFHTRFIKEFHRNMKHALEKTEPADTNYFPL
jgi:hypothetical protein